MTLNDLNIRELRAEGKVLALCEQIIKCYTTFYLPSEADL